MLDGVIVAVLRGLLRGQMSRRERAVGEGWRPIVGPFGFGAISLCGDAFDAIANLSARVAPDCAFHRPLIVINEKARRLENRQTLLHHVEFESRRDGVRRAAADLPLVVDLRTLRPKIDARGDPAFNTG